MLCMVQMIGTPSYLLNQRFEDNDEDDEVYNNFCRNIGIIFGKHIDNTNIRAFVQDLLHKDIIPDDADANIDGIVSIHHNTIENLICWNDNFKIIAAFAYLIFYDVLQINLNLNKFETECLTMSWLKTLKRTTKLTCDKTQQQLHKQLEYFVSENQGKVFSIAFSTSAEDDVKEYLLYKQSAIEVLSSKQTSIALPDVYFGLKDYHEILGLEYQQGFCQRLPSKESVKQLFRQAPETAIFYLQPLLSLDFQNSHANPLFLSYLDIITESLCARRELVGNDTVFRTFAAALETKNTNFQVLRFIFTYVASFGSLTELILLLIHNFLSHANDKLHRNRFVGNEANNEKDIKFENSETKSIHMLTRLQFELLPYYQQRIARLDLLFINALISNIHELDVNTAEHCVSTVTDMMWNKRHYYEAKRESLNEFDTLKANHMEQFATKCKELYDNLKLPQSCRSAYQDQLLSNVRKLKNICLFNQTFAQKYNQLHPNLLYLDSRSCAMLNPQIETDEISGDLLECFEYQVDQMKKYIERHINVADEVQFHINYNTARLGFALQLAGIDVDSGFFSNFM